MSELTCDVCLRESNRLLPMTVRAQQGPPHYVPAQVCGSCAGPAFHNERDSIMLPQQIRRGSGMVWPANGR